MTAVASVCYSLSVAVAYRDRFTLQVIAGERSGGKATSKHCAHSRPHIGEEKMPDLKTKRGRLTAYGFACGYVETRELDGDDYSIRLWSEHGKCYADALLIPGIVA